MAKLFRSAPALLLAFAAHAASAGAVPEQAPGIPKLRDVVKKVMPEVVDIQVLGKNKKEILIEGSGIVYDAAGLIVTNAHVVEKAKDIKITFYGGKTLPATIISADPRTDIALLRVKSDTPLSPATLGDSTALSEGDYVFAIGSPFAHKFSVTAGIISSLHQHDDYSPYDDFIQTDASINTGNSGGALFDLITGDVLGMNSVIYSPVKDGGSVGTNFTIPVEEIKVVVGLLKSGQKIHLSYLGVYTTPVNAELAKKAGLDTPRGVLIEELIPRSPAAEAHLAADDIIMTLNGQAIDPSANFPLTYAALPVGTKADLDIWSKGRERHVTLKVRECPTLEEDTSKPKHPERHHVPRHG